MIHIILWASAHHQQLVQLGAALCALGWAVEKVLEIVGTLSNSKMIDNLGVWLATQLQKIGAKPPVS